MNKQKFKSYLEASARQRISGTLDEGSFREFFPPPEKLISPHLKHFKIPVEFDDGAIAGEGTINGQKVGIIAQEGKFMGGAFGEVHSAKIAALMRRCLKTKPVAVVCLWDSGGVRLQEANAGEIGVTEIIKSILELRSEGIPVIGVVGGSCGCFGGAGIISAFCDSLIASEEGRVGVSGPEVIETTMGVEAFDSRDKALVWRTCGCKNRFLFGAVKTLVENDMAAFREAIINEMQETHSYSLDDVITEFNLLKERFNKFSSCTDAIEVWEKMGFEKPEAIPSLTAEELVNQRQKINGGTQ